MSITAENLRIHPSGDRALTVSVGNTISEAINRRIMAAADTLTRDPANAISEIIPSYNALEIFYDPGRITYTRLAENVKASFLRNTAISTSAARLFEIPCCYDSYFAPDMKSTADYTSLSREEIIHIHAGADYRVFMLGFLPGFPYLGDMDQRIAIPRLPVPRKKIPAGSVGIGGSQTGIYPMDSPGGWRLIGRTPLDLYDPNRSEPILLRAGDYIRFIPISVFTFYDIRKQILRGTYQVSVQEYDHKNNQLP